MWEFYFLLEMKLPHVCNSNKILSPVQPADLQFSNLFCSCCKHRDLDLPLRELHHLNSTLRRDRRGLEELTCHAAEGRAEGNTLGDVEPVLDAAAGEDGHVGDGIFDIEN